MHRSHQPDRVPRQMGTLGYGAGKTIITHVSFCDAVNVNPGYGTEMGIITHVSLCDALYGA